MRSIARLLSTLSNVQSKLMYLESENGLARRRIRELELELEGCKMEVGIECTRMLEEEDVVCQHVTSSENAMRGKKRLPQADQERFKEVVEEKKGECPPVPICHILTLLLATALEALIATLRAHLTRLTAELSSHQQLLTELRSQRESDHREVKKKSLEMEKLREEVERLAGEVDVLRAVVEEGLRERRITGEIVSQTHGSKEGSGFRNVEPRAAGAMNRNGNEISRSESEDIEYTSRNLNPTDPPDSAVRIDYAVLPSLTQALSPRHGLNDEHLRGQQKPNQSNGRPSYGCQSPSTSQTRSCSPALIEQQIPGPDESHRSDLVTDINCAPKLSPAPPARLPYCPQTPCRPATPIPARPSREKKGLSPSKRETPFPQIRGDRLEQLFFSVREHNSKTCTICRQGRHQGLSSALRQWPSWLSNSPKSDHGASGTGDADEGFVEGSEDDGCGYNIPILASSVKANGKQADLSELTNGIRHRKANDERKRLPPQAVLRRILRELEDDFTHYKRFACLYFIWLDIY
jgi:hypothetical protein